MPDLEAAPPARSPAAAEAAAKADLALLRDSFRDRLAPRVGEIETAWKALAGAVDRAETTEPLRHLHRLAHSLAGTAGTFGFPTVGSASRALERRVKELVEAGAPFEATAREEIAALLAALGQAAATA